MSEWREVTLGDVLTLQRGFDLPTRMRHSGPFPVISSAGRTGEHNEYKVEPPGIVIGRYGSLGSVHWVDEPFWPLNTALWVKDFKGNDPRFLSYLLETVVVDGSTASAVPGVNRNHLHLLGVRVPGTATQRRIAAVLSAFDEQIEINERRIELLEQQAHSLYRDLARTSGNDWVAAPLFDLAEVTFGYPFKANQFSPDGLSPVIRIRDIPAGIASIRTDEPADEKYMVDDGDLLIGMDGTFHMRQWSAGEAWLNQRVARLRPRGELSARHLMLSISKQIKDLNHAIVGTTVAHLGKRHLEEIEISLPPRDELLEAKIQFDSFANAQIALEKRNRQLAATRDLLLPRLVTGRLDISEVDLGVLEPAEVE